jgi:hypothetical protein
MSARKCLRTSWTAGQYWFWDFGEMLAQRVKARKYAPPDYLPFPFASAGAIDGHSEHNFDEHGMSLLK